MNLHQKHISRKISIPKSQLIAWINKELCADIPDKALMTATVDIVGPDAEGTSLELKFEYVEK